MHAAIINHTHDFDSFNLAITIIRVCINLLICTIFNKNLTSTIIKHKLRSSNGLFLEDGGGGASTLG